MNPSSLAPHSGIGVYVVLFLWLILAKMEAPDSRQLKAKVVIHDMGTLAFAPRLE